MTLSRRLLLGGVVAAAALTLSSPTFAQPEKPNIVLMLMDNLGYREPGVYGDDALRGASLHKPRR